MPHAFTMAHIYVYSPSGAVADRRAAARAIRRLEALGHEVELDPAALERCQRFAGDDDTRLGAIERAAASGADATLITRGGYGLTRLLPRMPWKAIADSAKKGTRWIGFSDFTALQLGLLAQQPAISWAGPALCEGFGMAQAEPDEITVACLEDVLSRQSEGTGWRLPGGDARHLDGQGGLLARQATLWGGNLAMICALVGTPWMPDVQDGVLFLEDVAEHPYRIERMLGQLLHAGVLGRQQAIVLGRFTDYKLTAFDRGYKLASVVDWLRSQIQVTVLTGLPFGHAPTKVLLPVGARVDLLVEGREAFVLWGHLH